MNLGRNKNPNLMVPAVIITVLAGLCAEAVATGPNLVGWWRFEEGSGMVAYDSAGDNDGTLVNGPTWTSGRIGGALSFDGVDDYTSIPPLNLSSNTVTMTAWIKRDGVQPNTYTGIVFSRDGSTCAGLNFGMGPGGWDDINHELSYHWNDRQATWDWDSGLFVPDNEWVFVALVIEPTKATMYLNDASATNVLNHDIEEFDGVTWIGQDAPGWNRNFKGVIDDVRIYDRSLPAEEIMQLYQESLYTAYNPEPEDGATYVLDPNTTVLSWSPGRDAASHDVYFGTNYNDVNSATTNSAEYMGNQYDNSYWPGPLESGRTYYWRIDEVGLDTWKGDVWRFKTWALVGWWKFDEGIGTTAFDSAGTNNGTIHGATWTSGMINGALSFGGNGDRVKVNDSSSMRSLDGSGAEYTISLWVKTTQTGKDGFGPTMFERRDTSPDEWVINIYLNGDNATSVLIGIAGGSTYRLNDTLAINDGNWHHITVTRKNTEYVRIYVDGNLRQSGSTTISTSTNEFTTIGVRRSNTGGFRHYFKGTIDDVRVYDSALSPTEVPMKFMPQVLNPDSKGKWVKAHFVLPEGFGVNDVGVDTPAKIWPFGIESEYIDIFINEDGLVEIEIAFDRRDFCRAAADNESVEVKIVGSLTNGLYYYGTDTIRIITENLKSFTLRNVYNNSVYLCDLNYNPLGPPTTSSSVTHEGLIHEPLLFTVYVDVPGYGHHMFTAANGGSGYKPVGKTFDVLYEAARHRYLRSDAILQQALADGFVFPADLIGQLNMAQMYLRQAAASKPGSSRQADKAIVSLQFSCPAAERLVVERARQIILQQGGLREEQFVSTFALYGYREGQPWKEAMDAVFNTGIANWHWQDVVRPNGTFNWIWWDGTVNPPQYLHSDDTVNMLYQELGKDVRGHCILWLLHHPDWPGWLDYNYTNVGTQIVNFAEAVVTRYPEIDVWDIAAEVTNSPYCVWTPEQMVEMVRAVSNKVAQCNPDAQRGINSVLLRGVDAAKNFDHDPVALCPYGFCEMLNDAGVDYEYVTLQLYYFSNTRDLFEVDQVLETYSRLGKRIRLESGAPSNSPQNTWYTWYRNWDPELQADWLEGMFMLCLSKDYFDEWNWWDLADYPGIFIATSGLLDGNYNPKPAYFRLQQLMNFWSEPDSSEVATTPQPLTLGPVWDLAADWSDTNNPNKTWSYGGELSGLWNTVFDLLDTHQSEWSPFTVGAGQPAWADTVDSIPCWYRSIGNDWWDCPAGRVACHTPSTIRWVSPVNGIIHISGGLWLRNSSRPQYWQLRHNDALISGGLLEYGPTSAVPLSYTTGSGGPEALIRTVKPGDVIELYLTKAASDYDFVGVDLTINNLAAP
jgi:hypothetical protein